MRARLPCPAALGKGENTLVVVEISYSVTDGNDMVYDYDFLGLQRFTVAAKATIKFDTV